MKVAIVYDRVNKFGGAERVLLALHEIFPNAPLYTSVYSKENAKWAEVFPSVRTSFLQRIPYAKNNHEFLAPLMPFAFRSFNFDKYDLVISVTSEFAKNIRVENGKHICYCLTPTRYLWSHSGEYLNFHLSIFTNPLIYFLKKIDKKVSKNPDIMIAISTEVQRRIKKYYERESVIIFPPVGDFQILKTLSLGPRKGVASHSFLKNLKGYYLLVSRLVKYKKVDLAIKAFNRLGSDLVIVGTGREENKLKKLANKNIHFAGFVNEMDLVRYYKNAKAFIFPQEEDFGITAVEAQSFGVPVIAYKAGGAKDTVIDGKTGILFEEQTVEDLKKTVRKLDTIEFDTKVLSENAGRFSKKKFQKDFLQVVKTLCYDSIQK